MTRLLPPASAQHLVDWALPVMCLVAWLWLWGYYVAQRLRGHDPLPREPFPSCPWDALDLWLVLAVFLGYQFGAAHVLDAAGRVQAAVPWMPTGRIARTEAAPLLLLMTLSSVGHVLLAVFVLAVTLRTVFS